MVELKAVLKVRSKGERLNYLYHRRGPSIENTQITIIGDGGG